MARGETIGRHLYNFAHMNDHPPRRRIPDHPPRRRIPPAPDWERAGSMTQALWRKLGRECLRQMEWAREHGSKEQASQECEHCCPNPGPLTLAPPDWSPQECST